MRSSQANSHSSHDSATEIDIFISYSRAADNKLAPALQRALARLAKPWNKARAVRVFRDQSDLSAAPSLSAEIETALKNSRYFLLLASPQAADSKWVGREIDFWRRNKSPDTFLIAVTDGEVEWNDNSSDFEWSVTNALPLELVGYFDSEPIWEDLRFARNVDQLSLRHSEFRSVVASLAAPVRGMPKEALDSEDVRQHRTLIRLRNAAIFGLVALLVAAIATGAGFFVQRNDAREQRDLATIRRLTAEAENLRDSDPELSRLLAATAVGLASNSDRLDAVTTLRSSLQNPLRHVLRHDWLRSSTLSSDGTRIVTGSGDGTIRLWDTATGRQMEEFSGDSDVNGALELTSNGQVLAAGSVNNQMHLWDTVTGRRLHALHSGSMGNFYAIRFSPDGSVLATATGDGKLIVWDVASGIQRWSFAGRGGIAFSPDGGILATGSENGVIRLWNMVTGGLIREIRGPSYRINELEFSSDGEKLAAGGLGETTTVWVVSTGQMLTEVASMPVGTVAFSPDGSTLATGNLDSVDSTVQLWDVSTGQRRARFLGRSVAFHPGGKFVATGGSDGAVRLWDNATGQLRAVLGGHTSEVTKVEFNPTGAVLASSSADHTVRLWSPGISSLIPLSGESSNPLMHDLTLGKSLSVVLSPDGSAFATSGRPARIWDAHTGKLMGELPNERSGSTQVRAFSPDGTIVFASNDNSEGVRAWDIRTGENTAVVSTERFGAFSVAYDPDSKRILVSSQDSVNIWDTETGRLIRRRQAMPNGRGAFSPDGRMAVTINRDDRTVEFWDAVTGEALRDPISIAPGVATIMGFSPNGDTLAISLGRVVVLLDPQNGTSRSLSGHTDSIFGVAFSPDSSIVATAGADRSVRLWDVPTGHLLGEEVVVGHAKIIRAAAFTPDGNELITLDDDAAVWISDVSSLTGDLTGNACTQAGRTLTTEEREDYFPGYTSLDICGK